MNIASVSNFSTSSVSTESGTTTIAQLKKEKTALEKELQELNQSQEDPQTKQTEAAALQLQIQQIQMQIQQLEAKAAKKNSGTPEEAAPPTDNANGAVTDMLARGALNTLA